METLLKMLKNHDWYYSFSDDNRVYDHGTEEWKKIQAEAKKHGRDGARLVKAYRDIHFNPGNGFRFHYDD